MAAATAIVTITTTATPISLLSSPRKQITHLGQAPVQGVDSCICQQVLQSAK